MTNNSSSVTTALRLIFYAAYCVVYTGFLFHRSDAPTIFSYSGKYAAVLAVALLPFLIPSAFAALSKRFGAKSIVFSIIPTVILILLLYIVAHFLFDYTREYRFDPYFQKHAQALQEQYAKPRRPGSFRILAMGGSTTKNEQLAPDKRRYTDVLERLLQERYPGVEIQVLNAGQDWWTTKHSLFNYVSYAEQWEPDLVIVMHAINDLSKSFSHPSFSIGEYNAGWTHHYAQIRDAAHAVTFEQYLVREYLTANLRIWFSTIRFQETDFPVDWYQSRQQFGENLERLARYVPADGPEVMFITQPFMYKPEMPRAERKALYGPHMFKQSTGTWTEDVASTASLARAMAAFNETTRRVADANGVLLVDAAARVPKNMQYFIDEVHYTPLGAATLAQSVADVVIGNRLVDTP